MTWRWLEGKHKEVETILTLEFAETDDGSELILTKSNHPDKELLEDHRGGWTACMDRIAEIL